MCLSHTRFEDEFRSLHHLGYVFKWQILLAAMLLFVGGVYSYHEEGPSCCLTLLSIAPCGVKVCFSLARERQSTGCLASIPIKTASWRAMGIIWSTLLLGLRPPSPSSRAIVPCLRSPVYPWVVGFSQCTGQHFPMLPGFCTKGARECGGTHATTEL